MPKKNIDISLWILSLMVMYLFLKKADKDVAAFLKKAVVWLQVSGEYEPMIKAPIPVVHGWKIEY
jgi:hypothetical protein